MAHLLDIETEMPERPIIAIDKKPYQLATPHDLDLEMQCLVVRTMNRSLWMDSDTAADVTDEQIASLAADIERCARALLLDCPEEVYAKLSSEHKTAVVSSFVLGPAKKSRSKSQPTSKRSQGSKGSTGAAPKSGPK